MRRLSFTILFFVSYIPLFLILFVQNFHPLATDGHILSLKELFVKNTIPAICLCTIFLSLLGYGVLMKFTARHGFRTPEKVIKVQNTGVEYLTYLGTYIIPFIGANFENLNSSVATLILILLICIIYPKTNLVYANPTLALFGFNIYKVKLSDDDDEERVVITKNELKKGGSYRFRKITDEVLFSKK